MGIETSTALLIGAAVSAASAAASIAMTPTMPQQDTTDYELLKTTQEQANAESDAAKARIEEARKREELRQQQMGAEGILTSDSGVEPLSIRKQVLGVNDNTFTQNNLETANGG